MIHTKSESNVVVSEKTLCLTAQTSLRTDPDSMPAAPAIIRVTDDERSQIARAAEQLLQEYGSIDAPEFRKMLPACAAQCLPRRIYTLLAHFRDAFQRIDFGALIFKGLVDVDQDKIGPTPVRWQHAMRKRIKPYEFIAALVHGALGGSLVQFYYQRNGGGFSHCVIQDPELRETVSGAGELELKLHTEGSNLYHSPDFITFFWLRNFEPVSCQLFSIRSLHMAEKRYARDLWEPIFKKPLVEDYGAAAQRWAEQTVPVLYGNPIHPWLRVDFIEQLPLHANQSQRAQLALEAFEQDAQAATYTAFVPAGGDLCVLNNKMCAHGRGPIRAGVDANANAVEKRWMLRMMSAVDRFAFYATAQAQDPYFSNEIHSGNTVDLT